MTLNGRLPFLQGISTMGREGFSLPHSPHPQANHKSSTSLQLVTGQDPGQTLPPSKSDSPPPHWRQPSLWGWGVGRGGPWGGTCLLRLDLRNVQTNSTGRGGRGWSRSLGQLKTASQEEPLSILGLFCQLPPGFLGEGKGGRF